ncbi:MAG: terminase family protein [Spirochaetes bacterium]|nr:terminase family protein [Spirochaetota bacterium]
MLREIAQTLDPVCFVEGNLSIKLDEVQREVLRNTGKRIILNICRQWGKSTIAAFKALHRAVHHAESLILLLSPSLRQSVELFRKVLDASYLIEHLPEKTEDSKLFMTLKNGSRIVSLPGKEGTVRGYSGADMIVIDEAASVPDDLYLAVRPMLAVSDGELMLISTPKGKRGFYYNVWTHGGKTWKRYEVNAKQCPRISATFLAEERESMPERWFMQEYFCKFLDIEDVVFPMEYIEAMRDPDVQPFYTGMVDKNVTKWRG